MTRILPVALAFILLLPTAALAAPEEASMACGTRAEMLGRLAGRYSEQPVAMGLASNGSMLEVLASTAGKSFTIVYTTPQGLTCMIAAGRNWEEIRQRLADGKA